jgi:hypothetical protein
MQIFAARTWGVVALIGTMGCAATDVTTVTDPALATDFAGFGGDTRARLDALPVAASQIEAILPLGTFRAGDALPSTDARVLVRDSALVAVHAMADGLVTEIDRTAGALTMRVRNQVSLRMGGIAVRPALRVGQVVRLGEHLGDVRGRQGPGGASPELAIRMFDEQIVRARWVRPERYGARRHIAFFASYLADSVRSVAYGLVRRAAPDLDGRIDYDRDGQLVGTWFDASVSPLAVGPAALTFAYDAERPGQVRIAASEGLARVVDLSGVHAVAWEDPDPARIDRTRGVVRYRLHAVDDRDRSGGDRYVLVQVLPNDRLRVEVVGAADADRATFSTRAVDLVR